jgi:oligopeptide transport system ATP-binding protein
MQEQPLLEVRNLKTRFKITGAYVHAVNGISYTLNEGDSLGVVGESGCGKSVGVMSVMRLIPQPPGEIYEGEVLYNGRDLLKLSMDEMRHVRGKEIAMIFQDPMTSLNPVIRIGRQITEALVLHMGMNTTGRAAELLTMVGIPRAPIVWTTASDSGGMRQRAMVRGALKVPRCWCRQADHGAGVTIQAQSSIWSSGCATGLGMAVI